jgi:hypothetical protein
VKQLDVLLQQGNQQYGDGHHMECEVPRESGQIVQCEVLTDSGQTVENNSGYSDIKPKDRTV